MNNLGPGLAGIGENLVASTRQRFASATAPDGTPWAPNTEVTLMEYMRNKSGIFATFTNLATRKEGKVRIGDKNGYYRKDGKLGKKGIDAMMGKRPLTGETGALSEQIHYRVTGNRLVVGSSMEYAAMHQFGGSRSDFPNLWGDIPARPFLGISGDDKKQIEVTVSEYLGLLR
jgi:phage gpG-like protein